MAKQNTPTGPTSNPPGGGSWRWDDATVQWVSTDPVPSVVVAPVLETVPAL